MTRRITDMVRVGQWGWCVDNGQANTLWTSGSAANLSRLARYLLVQDFRFADFDQGWLLNRFLINHAAQFVWGNMAQIRPIFQPVMAGHQHAMQLTSLVGEPWISDILLSSAFANSAGVDAISAGLTPVSGQCRAFIGVRNGSTTAQALAALLRLGVSLYGVDTATRSRIFHPKLFLATGTVRARAIIGSANLTHPGLFNNIEASADLDLDLTVAADKAFVDGFLARIIHWTGRSGLADVA